MRRHLGQLAVLVVGVLLSGGSLLRAADARQIADRIIARSAGTEGQLAEIEDLLEELGTIQTEDGTQILVSLLDYYLGEHNGEVLVELITKRGALSVPHLKRRMGAPILCKTRRGPRMLQCFTAQERNRSIQECLTAIGRGLVLWSVFPDDLYEVAEWDLKRIAAALEAYQERHGKLPGDLLALQRYVAETFYDRLRIYDPGGEPYGYVVDATGKYSLSSEEILRIRGEKAPPPERR